MCPPTGKTRAGTSFISGQSISLNLGEVLRGDRIKTSDIELSMGKDETCKFLCNQNVTRKDLRRARDLIEKGYVAEWIVDNLPGATSFVTVDKTRKYYAAGFKLGYKEVAPHSGKARYYLNNHITLVFRWRKMDGKPGERGEKVIIGFEVYTKSVSAQGRRGDGCPSSSDLHDKEAEPFELYMPPNITSPSAASSGDYETLYPHSSYLPPDDYLTEANLDDNDSMQIPWSYSIYWREDDTIPWSRRWDLYFVNQEEGSRIHWLAIVNSVIIVGLLSAIVALILSRTIRGDLQKGAVTALEAGKGMGKGRSKSKGRRSRPGSGSRTPRTGEKGLPSGAAGAGLLQQPDELARDEDLDLSLSLSDDDVELATGAGAGAGALEDSTGWKPLHADVFRPPSHGHILAPLLGSGVQLLFMAFGLLLLSSLGILNPSWRGGFVSCGVGLFVAAGVGSGWVSGRVWGTFTFTSGGPHGSAYGGNGGGGGGGGGATGVAASASAVSAGNWNWNWRANALLTATLFPGLLFALIFVLNLFVWAQASSTALPFTTLVALVALWLCIQLPLVYLGCYIGVALTPPISFPTHTASLKRPIPTQPWYVRPWQSALLGGLVPFAVMFVELLFVFQAVWADKSGYYYVFGFLLLIFVLLVVTVAEVTIVSIYLSLCHENHEWWWRSFWVGAGAAAWVFAYCAWYYWVKLRVVGLLSGVLFFCWGAVGCGVLGLGLGTVGVGTGGWFVRRIYG